MKHPNTFLWQRSLLIFIPLLVVILLVAGLSFSSITPASMASTTSKVSIHPDWPYVQDHVLVQLRPGARLPRSQFPGARALFDDWMAVPVPSGKSVIEAMNDLAQRDDVLLVEPDYIVQLHEPPPVRGPDLPRSSASYPNDPLYSYQWHMPQVQSDAAWNMSRGANVVVAVVDTGVSRGSDLGCRTFVDPYDAITDTEGEYAARDQNGHGTHVAGTIGQCTDNSVGVVGLAPDVTLMPVRVLDASGNGSMSQVGAGIRWAADHGADVINMSLGADCGGASYDSCHDAYVDSAISYAVSKDIVIVAASGNENSSTPGYPANHPDVMAVAAVDYSRNRAPYSNRGSALSVAAPGGDTGKDDNSDTYPDGVLQETFEEGVWGYYYFQGTSMASPHVAAAAALLRAYVPSASRTDVQEALEQTAMDLGSPGKDSDFGYGLIQVADALNYLKQQTGTSTPTPTPTPTTQPTSTPTATTQPTSTPTATPTSTTQPTTTPTVTPIPSFTPTAFLWLPLTWHSWPPATPTPTVTPTSTPQGDIFGHITYNNQNAPGIDLVLRMYDNTGESTVATTQTDSQGRYSFKNVPGLPAGKRYYVRFGPNGDDDKYVFAWFGPDITSYRQGEHKPGGDFDIADVKMVSPPNNATRPLPATFTWRKRLYTRDTYRLVFMELDFSQAWPTQDLGYVDSATIPRLPTGMRFGKAYGWYPRAMNGADSYGIPYYFRKITFAQALAQGDSDVEPMGTLLSGDLTKRALRFAPELNPTP